AELNSAQQDANEQILQKTALVDLMPKYNFDQQAQKPLTDNCMVPAGVDSHQGFPSLVHITAVDLKTQTLLGSTCINAPMQSFTMNEQHAFLTAHAAGLNGVNKTFIHQFTLSEKGASYSASGSVAGFINGDLSFWLNEKDGYVRVLSSDLSNQDTQHRISVLKEQKGELTTLAQLPNTQHPEKIGKPGESIYGARFVGDKAYVVTFRRTDPLYVVDLKTPSEPFIAGELQVPGFATYLHPVGENYLFTLGQSADDTGRVTGIKTELIDVSNPAKPISTKALYFGTNASNADALYDLHAVAVLPQTNGDTRFAFSINNYDQNYQWAYSGVYLFSVAGVANNKADLTHDGVVITEARSSQQYAPKYYGNGRSLLNGDAVYYGVGGSVWASNWNTPKQVTGPIPAPKPQPQPDPIACTADVRAGLDIHVYTSGAAACDTSIEIQDGDYRERPTGYYPGDSRTECVYSGAAERAGSYSITAKLKGFATQTLQTQVSSDRCHVITEQVTIKLAP
ncbi:MAG TPA: beta-propeller domain-containing protein, partial [Cellvibrionaceae bacterium]|nr:beta-propeller domain-containing protein [Cellvibrionaceae bacterium]